MLIFWSAIAIAQQTVSDTTKKLNQVIVKGYYNPQSLLRAIGAVAIIDSNLLKNQQDVSLVGAINTVAGARMEERSPGSYRLSLRGSLLRSPFGIRNIKIYIDDFPLTDAGGNTYLNSLDVSAIEGVEIYKGPEASSFGANTGGAVLISSAVQDKNTIGINLSAGSYGLLHQSANIQQIFSKYRFNITQGYQQSDGYRENSALKRKYIQTAHEWDYNAKGNLKAFFFYSDLNYETPGGLTALQLSADPKSARPATPTLPSAVQQQAAIFNETFFGGLSNSYRFNANFKHVIAVFTTHTDFKNPFITNYEKRKENTIGLRTFLAYSLIKENVKTELQIGLESSRTKSNIKNFNNDKGSPTSLQSNDKLLAKQDFAFFKANFDFHKRLLLEVGTSLNFFNYVYENYFPVIIGPQQKNFRMRLMPKLAASYLFDPNFSFRSSISKGYSPPTLAEIRSSDNIINTDLQAETGWNYESGIRFQSTNKKLFIDANIFYFHLKDAIVRRLNTEDVEYFINAGGTKQLGTEFQFTYWMIQNKNSHFLTGMQLKNSFTYSHFRFEDFKVATQDYSKNRLTGVPKNVVISAVELNFVKNLYFFAQHNYTSSIPLNDANTVFAKKYHLADLKMGVRNLYVGKTALDLSFGINNLFNQKYSLGNDLNAANNRYYNPAAGINYYTTLAVKL